MSYRSRRSVGGLQGARLAPVGALVAVSLMAWTATAVAVQGPALPKVMVGSNSKGRTIFRIKPRSILVVAWYTHPPVGYGPDHAENYGTAVKLKWSSWTATKGTAMGTFITSDSGSPYRVSVVVSRPRRGKFTQLSVMGKGQLGFSESFTTTVYDASQDYWTGTM